jgi:hypothetical protein
VVALHALEVRVEHPVWHEQAERERAWMTVEQAAACVSEPDLAGIIRAWHP